MRKFAYFVLALSFFLMPKLGSEDWKRVYLATYPRSGNHWVRFLLEEATHIATSSAYPDRTPEYQHLRTPFPWGGYCCPNGYHGNCSYPEKSDIVVIKTHYPCLGKTKFDCVSHLKTIRIVRHPVDSFYSYYVFSHRGKPQKKLVPSDTVKQYITSFRRFQAYYNDQDDVVTFRYEDLLENPLIVFSQILEAVGYSVRNEDIERAVLTFPPIGGLLKHRDKFRPKDLELINRELSDFLQQFDYPVVDIRPNY
ncbi:MAG: sulfotransferase domain-containing protein [Waddliaceae bacterium]